MILMRNIHQECTYYWNAEWNQICDFFYIWLIIWLLYQKNDWNKYKFDEILSSWNLNRNKYLDRNKFLVKLLKVKDEKAILQFLLLLTFKVDKYFNHLWNISTYGDFSTYICHLIPYGNHLFSTFDFFSCLESLHFSL